MNEFRRRAPAPPLRPFIASYSGYRQAGVPPAVHRGLPSPYLTVILTLDDPLEIRAGHFDALVAGLHTRPELITHPGRQSGVQVNLHPLGARGLTGGPAGELAGLDVPAMAVWGPDVDRIRAQLLEAPGWDERFDVLDRFFLSRLGLFLSRLGGARAGVAPELRQAWRQLRLRAGQVPVAALADEVGWSVRHLGNRFRDEVGLTPKAAARVVRFDRARRRIGAGEPLAAVAAGCGYFDQAHLAREFRELAGCSPTAWIAEEFQNVQDGWHRSRQAETHE